MSLRWEFTTRIEAPRMSGASEKKRRTSVTAPSTASSSSGVEDSSVMCGTALEMEGGCAVPAPSRTKLKAESTTLRARSRISRRLIPLPRPVLRPWGIRLLP